MPAFVAASSPQQKHHKPLEHGTQMFCALNLKLMLGLCIRRLLTTLPTALLVATFVFLLLRILPGDPLDVLLGETALPANRDALSAALKLDQPLLSAYGSYLLGLVQGNWGQSFYSQQPVLNMLWQRLPATLELGLAALAVALTIAIPAGVIAALNQQKWVDKAVLGTTTLLFALPSFVLGPLLMLIVAVWLGWLPVAGRGELAHVVLPAITLGAALSALTARLLRNSLLEILNKVYITTAQAKGASFWRQLCNHLLPNALLPVVTIVALQAGVVLTGAVLTEAVFAWPGVGQLLVDALAQRDYPLIQATVLFIALVYLLMSVLADVGVAALDPRVRDQWGAS